MSRLLICSLFVLAVCIVASSQQRITDSEYAVYSVVLKQLYTSDDVRLLVIQDYTDNTSLNYSDTPERQFKYIKQHLPKLSQETIINYKSKNRDSLSLARSFNLDISYVLLPREKFDGFAGEKGMMEMSEAGWARFYDQYPQSAGFLSLSRIGFDRKKSQALVYVAFVRGHQSGRMWGDGSYILVLKRKGRWRVQKQAAIWVH